MNEKLTGNGWWLPTNREQLGGSSIWKVGLENGWSGDFS